MQRKLIISGLVGVIGLLLAGRALWPVLFPLSRNREVAPHVLSPAAAALGPHLLDTNPAVIGAPVAVARAVERASGEAEALGLGNAHDLIQAFRERLEATIAADYERDMRAKIARGIVPPDAPPSRDYLLRWQAQRDYTRNVKLGLEHLEVRWIARNGERQAPTGADEGYSTLVYTKKGTTAFPLPEKPIARGFDIIEVRLPMGLEPVKGDSRGAVLVGYRFAWHPEREQWVPSKNVIYKPDGEIYGALPF